MGAARSHLPPEKLRTGRPSRPHREMVDAVLWVLATGAPWRDLPTELGPWPSACSRFRRWEKGGVWSGLMAELQREAHERGDLDWRLHFVDGSVVRAHVGAAMVRRLDVEEDSRRPRARGRGGREKGGDQALGHSRGGFSTKVHARCEGKGRPILFVLSGGERHGALFLPALMEAGAVGRRGPGRPRLRPEALAGDRGYSYPTIRRYLRARGIRAVIPSRKDQPPQPRFDKEAYRARNAVECLFGRLEAKRRLATRYEKLARTYLAMLTLAAILEWL